MVEIKEITRSIQNIDYVIEIPKKTIKNLDLEKGTRVHVYIEKVKE
jgi:uncharacterized membrane protein (UPF0127 family)